MPTMTDRGANARSLLSDAEWAAVDAIRAGLTLRAAADAHSIDEIIFRRTLSTAADKLRMVSSLRDEAATPTDDARLHVPHMEPCPYCEFLGGQVRSGSGPPAVLHEDPDVCVFLAPTPLGGMPGHTLVTTRRHVETIFDLTDDEACAVGVAVARTARMLRTALDPEGLLISQHNGVAAFQSVPHIHYHVIPKVAGPFPPTEAPAYVPADARMILADEIRQHW